MDQTISSKLWRFLFEKEKLTLRLAELAKNNEELFISTVTAGTIVVKVQYATVPGDNYMSNAYRIVVKQAENEEIQYQAFVKTVATLTMMFQGAMAENLYGREIGVFTRLHPMLRELREKVKVSADRIPLNVPQIYYSHYDAGNSAEANTTVMVFEDLKLSGYRMLDRRVGASFSEAKFVLESLANYHALTIALLRQFTSSEGEIQLPEKLAFAAQFNEAMLDVGYQVLGLSIGTFGKMLLKNNKPEVADWLDKEYKEELQAALRPLTIDQCKPLVCISHGDCWSNNMMFRYDESGQVVEMRLVDWQISRFGHPTTDVVHFLYSSTTSEMRERHLGELLNHYYDTLTSALDLLRCRVIEENQYSRRRFLKDVQTRLHFAMAISLLMLPPIMEDSYGAMMLELQSNAEKPLANEGGETAKNAIPDQPFDIEAIGQNMPLDKLLQNEPLCKRVVSTAAEIKRRLEQNSVV